MKREPRPPRVEKVVLKSLLVRIPADLFRRVKVRAAEREMSLQKFVAEALEKEVQK